MMEQTKAQLLVSSRSDYGWSTHPSQAIGNQKTLASLIRKLLFPLFGHRSHSTWHHVPRGHLAVYVGEERQSFVILIKCLSHPLFQSLLTLSQQEFGYCYQGGLSLPCEVATFKDLMCQIKRDAGTSCASHHVSNGDTNPSTSFLIQSS
ncbi:hypothetical protein O6H91_05G121300 [Diphasiastrum complanatum]|nr:hypothetical protein O6H91_05G121300 [Diphasiastrum complanatum]